MPKERGSVLLIWSVRNSQTVSYCQTSPPPRKQPGASGRHWCPRPGKAVLYTLQPNAAETPELTAARFAAEVRANIRTESNMRGSAEYRNHLAGVLVKRAVLKLEGNR